jgi:formamidopyrimidine-DNA glycosylase
VRLGSPFLLRSVELPLEAATGHTVTALRRVGKRIAIGPTTSLARPPPHDRRPPSLEKARFKLAGRNALAAFDFDHGCLTLTEAGSQRKASLLVVGGAGPAAIDPGGIEVLHSTPAQFAHVLRSANHTLKRALTDPKLFQRIGNAYSDEILHHARLSPLHLTQKLTECRDRTPSRLHPHRDDRLDRLPLRRSRQLPEASPFRDDMAVRAASGKLLSVCAAPVQRIRYATNEQLLRLLPNRRTRAR